MTTERQAERAISEVLGAITDPIVVFIGGEQDPLPDWLRQAIRMERLVMNIQALKTGIMTGTDAEACAYLMTASLSQPPSHDWAEIYLYVATKTYEKYRTKDSGFKMPADVRVDSLSDYQMQELDRLKAWLYRARVKVREERERAARREKKEADKAKSHSIEALPLFSWKKNT
jgi:hypothetical protein